MKDLTTVKQGKATTVQDCSGKCLTEEREVLNQWTEYCIELYNHKANGDPSVLKCPQTHTEDDHPILRKEVEAAIMLQIIRNRSKPQAKKIIAEEQTDFRAGRLSLIHI